jgi:hypothetical protein
MRRVRSLYLLLTSLASLVVLLFPASSITHSEKLSATVEVDCTNGDKINKALSKHPKAQKLIVEIRGMCQENVVVTRDGVTLHGADPANDGIQAEEDEELTDPTVWVRGATMTTVENLTLTGGFSGLLASNANLPDLRITNCRLVSNRNFGLQLENSLASATDTTFKGAGVFFGSRLNCTHCTLEVPPASGVATLIVVNSIANINQQSTFSGGHLRIDGSLVNILDSNIGEPAPNVFSLAASNSTVNLTRVQIDGRMVLGQSSNATLNAVTQSPLSGPPNQVSLGSHVVVGSAGQPAGGPPNINSSLRTFDLNSFSNLVLNSGSLIDGNLICRAGSDAFCANPANVTGQTSCGQCPKP